MIKSAVAFLLWVLFFSFIGIFIVSALLGYQSIMGFVLLHIYPIKHPDLLYKLITHEKFVRIQIYLVLVAVFCACTLYYFKSHYDEFVAGVGGFILSIKKVLAGSLTSDFRYLLIIPFLTSIVLVIYMPPFMDEAYTYLNFTTRGIIASTCYYPSTNNHILNSLVSNFTNHLPVNNPLIRIRTALPLVNLLYLIFSYSFLSWYYNRNFAAVVVSVSSMLFLSIFYSYHTRGYAFVSLFFCLFALLSF